MRRRAGARRAFALLFVFVATALQAKEAAIGFRQGMIFTDVSVASPGRVNGGSSYFTEDPLAIRNYFLLGRSTDTESRNLAVYSLFLRPSGTAFSSNGRLGFEYGYSDRVGVGYSIEATRVYVRNVPHTSTHRLSPDYMLFFSRFPSTTAKPGFVELTNAYTVDQHVADLGTVNFEVAYHFVRERFVDPYVRFTFGLGSYGSYTLHGGASLGLRVHLGRSAYFFAEGFGNYYRTWPKGGGGGGGSSSDSSSDSGGGGEAALPARSLALDGVTSKGFDVKLTRFNERSVRAGVGYVY